MPRIRKEKNRNWSKEEKIRIIGLIISILCVLIFSIIGLTSNPYYETTLKCSADDFYYNDTYKIYLEDDKYGKLNIEYSDDLETYCIAA